RHHVADRVNAEVPDVDVARRVGQHLEDVALVPRRLGRVVEPLALPELLPARLVLVGAEGLDLASHRRGIVAKGGATTAQAGKAFAPRGRWPCLSKRLSARRTTSARRSATSGSPSRGRRSRRWSTSSWARSGGWGSWCSRGPTSLPSGVCRSARWPSAFRSTSPAPS